VRAAFSRERAIVVESPAPGSALRDEGIEQHVAGTGVEGCRFACRRAFAQERDVGDAAEIERDAILVCGGEQQRVDVRNQRRAVTAGSRIGAAKIVADGRVDGLADNERVADLQRHVLRPVVPDRLPMRRDEVERFTAANLVGGPRVGVAERVVQPRDRGDAAWMGRQRGEQFIF
jgi:hypothetical protein